MPTIIDQDQAHVMHTYARFPVALTRGEGAALFDVDGKRYIDLASGIGTNSVGYAHPKWVAAVAAQAATLQHTSNLYYTEPGARLAARLCELSGMSSVFFANSGAESNEALIKLARKYSADKYGASRAAIITLGQSFHGRTITTLSATGQDKFHQHFHPFTDGFRHVPAGDIDALAGQGSDVCAVLLETIQGEGGVLPLSDAYLTAVQDLCAARDWLFLIDEVQTGVGRTGRFFSYQHAGLKPDAISFAKGIAGGLPLGGVLANAKASAVLTPGTHATTFGMNPICCAAALAVIEILVDDGAMNEVERKGARLRQALEAKGIVTRGRGLMIGADLPDAPAAVRTLIQNGILALTANTALRLLPPLTITDAELDEALEIMNRLF